MNYWVNFAYLHDKNCLIYVDQDNISQPTWVNYLLQNKWLRVSNCESRWCPFSNYIGLAIRVTMEESDIPERASIHITKLLWDNKAQNDMPYLLKLT